MGLEIENHLMGNGMMLITRGKTSGLHLLEIHALERSQDLKMEKRLDGSFDLFDL